MTVHHYLLEIGTEELPAGFLQTAQQELAEKTNAWLASHQLVCKTLSVYATPRRLAVLLEGLPEKQASFEQVLKGPPVRIGLDNKQAPTQAAIGFAKKAGISVDALQPETIDGEAYLVCRQTVSGKKTTELLSEGLLPVVLSLSGSHFMVWGEGSTRFSRPIRWLVSLWDETHLPVSVEGLASGTTSRGHRLLETETFPITAAKSYLSTLEANGRVLADSATRLEQVRQQLNEKAAAVGGCLPEGPETEALLETVIHLVEWPWVLAGRFDEAYLALPREVLTTVMAAHQKYFPVEKDGNLLPVFLVVSNGLPQAEASICKGNERVLRARFEDARFFFETDRKMSLDQRVDALQSLMFQKGLGTLHQKTERLQVLAPKVIQNLTSDPKHLPEQTQQVTRAARLAKTDLITNLVRELTELQGVMGSHYARLDGEPEAVSKALFEQYLPRFMGDRLPETPVGIALSLADKIDTLVAVFSLEDSKLPSGSKDPLGLRRMVMGMIQTILSTGKSVNITDAIAFAYQQLGEFSTLGWDKTAERLQEFMLQRLKGYLLELGYRYDLIDAVLENGQNPFSDLCDVVNRLEVLKTLVDDSSALEKLYAPAFRIQRILGEGAISVFTAEIQSNLFQHETESALAQAIDSLPALPLAGKQEGYQALVKALTTVHQPVDAFFEAVLVNDPDAAVRENRRCLLGRLNRYYLALCQFGKLVVS